MPSVWNLWRSKGAKPTDPARLQNEAGQFLAGEDGEPIELILADGDPVPAPTASVAKPETIDLAAHPAFAAMQAKLDAVLSENGNLKGQVTQLVKERSDATAATLQAQAEAFAERVIVAESRFLPAGRDQIIRNYLRAARADAANPPKAGEPGALADLIAQAEATPPHALTVPMLPHAAFQQAGELRTISPGAQASAEQERDRQFSLMAATEAGRTALSKFDAGKAWLAAHAAELNGFALPSA
jgi:hypothetical protein